MKETPQEMADRIEAEARASQIPEDRDYGLMVAGVIRKSINQQKST
jgi:hypothetical protein